MRLLAALRRLWPGLWRDLVLNGVFASPVIPPRARFLLLRLWGFDAAPSNIASGVWFGSRHVRIGRGTFINHGCFFSPSVGIELGQRVNLGMQVMLIAGSHDIGGPARRAGAPMGRAIKVGDGAWLGARVTVLPGVTIGAGAIVAAGALVASDLEPHSVYAGVPARRVRGLPMD